MKIKDVKSKVNEGWSEMRPIDRDRYQERKGLEGPFQTKAGKVVYYDPIEGAYYDPDTDMYLTYSEWKALDETGRVQREFQVDESVDDYVEVARSEFNDVARGPGAQLNGSTGGLYIDNKLVGYRDQGVFFLDPEYAMSMTETRLKPNASARAYMDQMDQTHSQQRSNPTISAKDGVTTATGLQKPPARLMKALQDEERKRRAAGVQEDRLGKYRPGVTVLTREISFNDHDNDIGQHFDGAEDYETVKRIRWPYGIEVSFNDSTRSVRFKTAKMKTVAKLLDKHIDFDTISAAEMLDLPAALLYSSKNNNEEMVEASYRDSGYRNMHKADRKASKQADKDRAKKSAAQKKSTQVKEAMPPSDSQIVVTGPDNTKVGAVRVQAGAKAHHIAQELHSVARKTNLNDAQKMQVAREIATGKSATANGFTFTRQASRPAQYGGTPPSNSKPME